MEHDYRAPLGLSKILGDFNYFIGGREVTLLLLTLSIYLLIKKKDTLSRLFKTKLAKLSLILISGGILLILIKSLFSTPIFEARYLIILAPACFTLISLLFSERLKLSKYIYPLLIITTSIASIRSTLSVSHRFATSFDEVVQFVNDLPNKDKVNTIFVHYQACPKKLFFHEDKKVFCLYNEFQLKHQIKSIKYKSMTLVITNQLELEKLDYIDFEKIENIPNTNHQVGTFYIDNFSATKRKLFR